MNNCIDNEPINIANFYRWHRVNDLTLSDLQNNGFTFCGDSGGGVTPPTITGDFNNDFNNDFSNGN